MASTTKQTNKPTTSKVHPLVAQQQAKIEAYNEETATLERLAAAYTAASAKNENDLTVEEKKVIEQYRSASGRKANRSKEIRQIQLSIREANQDGGEQIEFTEWHKPKNGNGNGSKRPTATQEQIQADLDKVGAIRNMPGADVALVHDCDVRIKGLLRQAESAGYEVTDPRVSA